MVKIGPLERNLNWLPYFLGFLGKSLVLFGSRLGMFSFRPRRGTAFHTQSNAFLHWLMGRLSLAEKPFNNINLANHRAS
jgi:hypothetical protein